MTHNINKYENQRIGTFCEKCRNVICVCGQVQAFKDSMEVVPTKIDNEDFCKWLKKLKKVK